MTKHFLPDDQVEIIRKEAHRLFPDDDEKRNIYVHRVVHAKEIELNVVAEAMIKFPMTDPDYNEKDRQHFIEERMDQERKKIDDDKS